MVLSELETEELIRAEVAGLSRSHSAEPTTLCVKLEQPTSQRDEGRFFVKSANIIAQSTQNGMIRFE